MNGLGFNPDTIDIVSKEYATNPRRIIQFFNNLAVEIHNFKINFDDEFILKYESLICKLLIIREEWPQYYKLLSSYPHLVNGESEIKSLQISNLSGLELFLKSTKAISKGVEVIIFDKLLSNGNVFDNLTTEIIEAIDNQDFEKISILFNSEQSQKDETLNYCLDQLSKGINRKSYGTLVPRMFNTLVSINEKFELSKSDNRRVQNVVEDSLDNFIKYIDVTPNLILYIDSLHNQRINYFSDFIVKYITVEYSGEVKEEYDEFCTSMLKSFVSKTKSLKILKDIKEPFTVFFNKQDESLENLIESEKVEFIFTENLFEQIISKLVSTDTKTSSLDNLIFISKNIKLSTIKNEAIFQKMNTLYPNFTNQNKQFLLSVIQNLNPLIDNLSYKKTHTQTESFVSKILSNRTDQNRTLNIITEVISDPEEIQIIINFIQNIYKATNCTINVAPYYSTIAKSNKENRSLVNKSLIFLKSEFSFPLIPLYDVIMNDETYEDDTFILLKHVMSSKDEKGIYMLEEKKLIDKIQKMANLIFDKNENSERIITFFEKLISEPPVKLALSNIISGKSKEEILRLSPTLLKLSFDKITQSENLFDYQDDIEVLKAIGESGEKSHLTKLTKVILSKLLHEETYNQAFKIIETVQNFNERDTISLTSQLENIADNKNFKEQAEQLMKKLNKK